ncbi:mycothiol synthase [Propionicicella superfundia]|uniref:mycothiol synthase n=1 Tax=Propionicicella superfundia TaxID=348582 RepID=UPI00042113AB|nr:mycothiol synthase [Propionicicella superfundia]
MLTTREPSPDFEASVLELARAVADHDDIDPLNEAARLALRTPGAAVHWLVEDGASPAGYAQWHVGDTTGLVAVHPAHRRQGVGRTLLDRLAAHAGTELAVWAFGDLPAARALAAAAGLTPVRGLHQMSRPLADLETPRFADGIVVRSYDPADLVTLHAMNAEAFAGHPEQGRLTIGDLRQRMAEPWFDPAGLLLAFAGDEPLGFHWTKRETATVGEVYVLGVVPAAAGRGLGTALLWAGLHRLRDAGCHDVELFVDADNVPAVQLYEGTDFAIVRTDTLYRPQGRTA